MNISEMNEQQLRELEVETPKSLGELDDYITALVDRNHDYGTCVYAMSMAAVAAFNYVASQLGVTGFQASCADLDIIRRTRRIDGPFALINAHDMLYPQYNIKRKVGEYLTEWKPWAAEQAKQKLASCDFAHPDVVSHWKDLAGEV